MTKDDIIDIFERAVENSIIADGNYIDSKSVTVLKSVRRHFEMELDKEEFKRKTERRQEIPEQLQKQLGTVLVDNNRTQNDRRERTIQEADAQQDA